MNLRNLRGKTIIVKKGDIILGEAMGLEDEAINIFIDQGNLYLKNPTSTGNLKEFDAFGFPAQHADDSNSRANYLKGNFVINGLIMGIGQDNATPTPLNNKWYINGKIASFNTYGDPSEKRITTLKTIL